MNPGVFLSGPVDGAHTRSHDGLHTTCSWSWGFVQSGFVLITDRLRRIWACNPRGHWRFAHAHPPKNFGTKKRACSIPCFITWRQRLHLWLQKVIVQARTGASSRSPANRYFLVVQTGPQYFSVLPSHSMAFWIICGNLGQQQSFHQMVPVYITQTSFRCYKHSRTHQSRKSFSFSSHYFLDLACFTLYNFSISWFPILMLITK